MSKRRKIDRNAVRRYRRRLARLLVDATPSDIEAASAWYAEAYGVAQDVAYRLGVSVEHGAAIVSAFSPRVHWSRNVTLAIDYAEGRQVKCLGQSLKSAESARVSGIDALKGPKIHAFARAIAGDDEAIVIDVWMMRAAGFDARDAPTTVQYREISSAIRSLATEWRLSPRTMQALLWIIVRGRAY